jgi:glycosyltransferase involved in cell wall biosynthesis
MTKSEEILVSVCMITYNHANYVLDAIRGVLEQKGEFKIQLIISDDNSKDDTRLVIEDFLESNLQKEHVIEFYPNQENVGVFNNFFSTLGKSKGEFIAICEGDDYWVDPLKLQKQIDFLQENSGFTSVFTNSFVVRDFEIITPNDLYLVPSNSREIEARELFFEGGGLYPTASLMYRRFQINPPIQLKEQVSCDAILIFMLFEKGKIYYLNENTSAYRIHGGGVYSGLAKNDFKVFEDKINSIKILLFFKEFFKGKWNKEIDFAISNHSRLFLHRTLKYKVNNEFVLTQLRFYDYCLLLSSMFKVYFKKIFIGKR